MLYLVNALRFEYRLRRAEAALRSIETEDSLQRWGRQSFLETESSTDMTGFVSSGLARGLKPTEIAELARWKVEKNSPLCGEDCSICITDFVSGDSVRRLPDCEHVFHRECID